LEGAQKHAGNESAFSSQNFVTEILQMTKKAFEKKAAPSLRIAQRVGNMGSAAVFVNLVSFLISDSVQELTRNRVATYFSIIYALSSEFLIS
jgi:3-hydroxy-3-methylglutaryl CoA synthase